MKAPPLPGSANGSNVVTASDLVRHFGVWQERANRESVYVLHRGRPRFVLTSVEIMQTLCAPHGGMLPGGADIAKSAEPLLDLTRDIMLLVDEGLTLIAASRQARGYFGENALRGAALADLLRTTSTALLTEAVRRVMASGLAEEIETAGPYAGRSIAVAIDPIGAGACLRVNDVTMVDDIAAIRAAQIADADALAATRLAALGRINLRGYLEPPFAPIAAMAGIDSTSLARTRFVGLIDVGTRIAAGEAIEAAIDTRAPTSVDATLLVCGATPKPVRLGFSPSRRGSRIDAVSVAMVAR